MDCSGWTFSIRDGTSRLAAGETTMTHYCGGAAWTAIGAVTGLALWRARERLPSLPARPASLTEIPIALRAAKADEDFPRVRGRYRLLTRVALIRSRDRTRALASEGAVAFPASASRLFNGVFAVLVSRQFVRLQRAHRHRYTGPVEGRLSPRVLGLVTEWAARHRVTRRSSNRLQPLE
jgi:hypothetical protein